MLSSVLIYYQYMYHIHQDNFTCHLPIINEASAKEFIIYIDPLGIFSYWYNLKNHINAWQGLLYLWL